MKKVTFTLKSGQPLTLFVGAGPIAVSRSAPFVIHRDDSKGICDTVTGTCINDGVHNNGGWIVQESYEEVIARLSIALGDFS